MWFAFTGQRGLGVIKGRVPETRTTYPRKG